MCALTFVPCTRLIILGNELLIGSNTSFTDPLFRHLSCAIAFSICPQLTNVRPTRSLLAISTLLIPLITASPSALQIWLGKSIALAHEAFLSLTQTACRWLRSSGCIFYSLQDYAVTPCTRLHSSRLFVVEPGLHDLGIRKLIPSCSSALG